MEEFTEILEALEAGDLSAYTDEQLADARSQIHEYGKALKDTEASGDDLAQLVEDAKTLKSAMSSIDAEIESRAEKATAEKAEKDEAFAAFEDEEESEEITESEEPEAEEVEDEKEPIQAAAVIRRRGEIRRPPEADPKEDKPKAIVAAAVGAEEYGQQFGSPEDAGRALWDAARRGGRGEQAVLRIPVDTGTILSGDSMDNFAKLRNLRSGVQKARMGEQALVAAGFCAPAQVVYDFFQASQAGAGLIDLPEANAPRGRVSHPTEFGPVDIAGTAGVGIEFTGADDAAGTTKDCYTVDCGDEDLFEVSATYTCLRFSNFDQQFYPERVAHVEEEAIVLASHNTNGRLIADIVTSPRTTFVNDLEDGGGSWVTFIRSVARESKRYRQRHKLPLELTLDLVVPYWFAGSLAADTTARDSSTIGSLVAAMGQINAELAKLNVSAQWVYDWQETEVPGAFDGFVSYLLYAPGSVVRLRGGTIDVGVVRDHTLNLANDFSLFVETFDGIAVPGYEVLYVSGVPACPTGATGARVTITCAGS